MLVNFFAVVLIVLSMPCTATAASLRIFSNVEDARVYVEGNYVGKTKTGEAFLLVEGLVEREYDVKITTEGYDPWSRKILVREGVPNSLEVELIKTKTEGLLLVEYDLVPRLQQLLNEWKTTIYVQMVRFSVNGRSFHMGAILHFRGSRFGSFPIGDHRLTFCAEVREKSTLFKEGRVSKDCADIDVQIRVTRVPVVRAEWTQRGLDLWRVGFIDNCPADAQLDEPGGCLHDSSPEKYGLRGKYNIWGGF